MPSSTSWWSRYAITSTNNHRLRTHLLPRFLHGSFSDEFSKPHGTKKPASLLAACMRMVAVRDVCTLQNGNISCGSPNSALPSNCCSQQAEWHVNCILSLAVWEVQQTVREISLRLLSPSTTFVRREFHESKSTFDWAGDCSGTASQRSCQPCVCGLGHFHPVKACAPVQQVPACQPVKPLPLPEVCKPVKPLPLPKVCTPVNACEPVDAQASMWCMTTLLGWCGE